MKLCCCRLPVHADHMNVPSYVQPWMQSSRHKRGTACCGTGSLAMASNKPCFGACTNAAPSYATCCMSRVRMLHEAHPMHLKPYDDHGSCITLAPGPAWASTAQPPPGSCAAAVSPTALPARYSRRPDQAVVAAGHSQVSSAPALAVGCGRAPIGACLARLHATGHVECRWWCQQAACAKDETHCASTCSLPDVFVMSG